MSDAPLDEPPSYPVGITPNLAMAVIMAGRAAREDVEARLRNHGTTMRHLSALGHLAATPGSSYSELARRAGITVQSMQSTVRQLEEQGAVQRMTEPGRGRTAGLRVTSAGRDLLQTGRGVLDQAENTCGADLDTEERETLIRLLRRTHPRT